MKIAGVAQDGVSLELVAFVLQEDLPSLSQDVEAVLEQWLTDRRTCTSGPPGGDGDGTSGSRHGVLHPVSHVLDQIGRQAAFVRRVARLDVPDVAHEERPVRVRHLAPALREEQLRIEVRSQDVRPPREAGRTDRLTDRIADVDRREERFLRPSGRDDVALVADSLALPEPFLEVRFEEVGRFASDEAEVPATRLAQLRSDDDHCRQFPERHRLPLDDDVRQV